MCLFTRIRLLSIVQKKKNRRTIHAEYYFNNCIRFLTLRVNHLFLSEFSYDHRRSPSQFIDRRPTDAESDFLGGISVVLCSTAMSKIRWVFPMFPMLSSGMVRICALPRVKPVSVPLCVLPEVASCNDTYVRYTHNNKTE